MAYKSRVTNQYMGATFAGQVQSSDKSDVTDLVNILQKEVNPALAQIADKYVATKKDVAKEKINQLLLTKDSATVQQEILAGAHPELSNAYVGKVVAQETGKADAAAAIVKIQENKLSYDFRENNLPAFYKQYLPDFRDKDGAYALGFASIFNQFKAKDAINDAEIRSKYAADEQLKQGASILSAVDVTDFWGTVNSRVVPLPPEEGQTQKRYLRTYEQANNEALLHINNIIDSASSTSELYRAEQIINSDRGIGSGGNPLGSLYSNRESSTKAAKLIEKFETKQRVLANAEYTQMTRAKEAEKDNYMAQYFNVDQSTLEGQLEASVLKREMLDKYPSIAVTLNSTAKNINDMLEDKTAVTTLEQDVMNGKYNYNNNGLNEEWRRHSNNPETLSSLLKLKKQAEADAAAGYTPPFQEPAFTKTVGKINKIIVDLVPSVDKKYQSQKNQYVSDLISQEMQSDYLDWLKDNPRPPKNSADTVKNNWFSEQQKFFNTQYNDKIKTYSQSNWLTGIADRINKEGIDLSSNIDLDNIAEEFYENRVNDAVEKFKPFMSKIESESDLNMIDRAQTLMSTRDFQALLKQKGFEGFATDPIKQKALASELIKKMGIQEKDFTDEINQLNDTIKQNLSTFTLPKIETYTPLGLIEKSSSVENQRNFFVNTIEQLTGRPVTKEIYNKILTPDAKLNLAKAFDISSVQLDALVSEYLK